MLLRHVQTVAFVLLMVVATAAHRLHRFLDVWIVIVLPVWPPAATCHCVQFRATTATAAAEATTTAATTDVYTTTTNNNNATTDCGGSGNVCMRGRVCGELCEGANSATTTATTASTASSMRGSRGVLRYGPQPSTCQCRC